MSSTGANRNTWGESNEREMAGKFVLHVDDDRGIPSSGCHGAVSLDLPYAYPYRVRVRSWA